MTDYKALMKKSAIETWPWVSLFIAGLFVGIVFYRQLSPVFETTLSTLFDLAGSSEGLPFNPGGLFLFYFIKNSIVALLCFGSAKLTKGIFPAFVVILNGAVISFFGVFLHANQICGYRKYVQGLATHGIVELFAIFLACSIGMQKMGFKTKAKLFAIPLILLLVAALLETFVSPLVINS